MTDTRTDDAGHGQDPEFEAAFAELHKAPPHGRADEDGGEASSEAGATAPASDAGAPEAPSDQAKDPWEGASPELLAARDALIIERDAARHSDQSQRGRVAGLNRRIEELSRSAPPQQPQGDKGDGKPEGDGDAAAERTERIKQLREDYPDVAGPLLDLLDEQRQQFEALGASVKPALEATSEAQVQAQLSALAAKHPDWNAIASSQDFAGWLGSQPEAIQGFANSYDATEVSTALTLFKAEREASKEADAGKPGDSQPQEQQRDDRRERQLSGARAPASRPAPAASGAPDDFDGAFEHFRRKREVPARR